MSVQIIKKDGSPEWAVIPYQAYIQLIEDTEMLQDIRLYEDGKAAIAAGEKLIPAEVTFAIIDGLSPVKVWREYRGLTQQILADAAGISKPCLSQIESGKRNGTTEVLGAIAKALGLSLDDLI